MIETYYSPTATPRGSVQLPRARVLAMAYSLAGGPRPWDNGNPLELPALPDGVTTFAGVVDAVNKMAATGVFDGGELGDQFWRPSVGLEPDGCLLWQPLMRADRHVWLSPTGGVRWVSGTGERSTFIGRLLVATAGELWRVRDYVKLERFERPARR